MKRRRGDAVFVWTAVMLAVLTVVLFIALYVAYSKLQAN